MSMKHLTLFKTEDPRNQTWMEADGIDYYTGRDPETGFPTFTPAAASDDEKRQREREGLRRELEGCERRLIELDELKSHRPPPPDWVIEDAVAARDAVAALLAAAETPTPTGRKR